MLVLGFFHLLRRSELVNVRVSDIVLKESSNVRYVLVRESKTDQMGRGERVALVKRLPLTFSTA